MKLVLRGLAWLGVGRRGVQLDERLRPYRAGGALPAALRHGTLLLQERLRPYQPGSRRSAAGSRQ